LKTGIGEIIYPPGWSGFYGRRQKVTIYLSRNGK